MRLKEIRIGNWVQIDDLPPEQITLKTFSMLNSYEFHSGLLSPISITSEILEKAGFEKQVNGVMKLSIQNSTYIEIDLVQEITVITDLKGEVLFIPYSQPLRLHQLQNLYFALTGEEIPIEL